MRCSWLPQMALAVAVIASSCAGAASQVSPSDNVGVAGITPSTGPVGTTVTVTGRGFARGGNVVKFGRGYIRDLQSTDGVTLSFEVPGGLDLCAPDPAGPCPGGYPRVAPGEYEVAVRTENETSNSVTFTVTSP